MTRAGSPIADEARDMMRAGHSNAFIADRLGMTDAAVAKTRQRLRARDSSIPRSAGAIDLIDVGTAVPRKVFDVLKSQARARRVPRAHVVRDVLIAAVHPGTGDVAATEHLPPAGLWLGRFRGVS